MPVLRGDRDGEQERAESDEKEGLVVGRERRNNKSVI